MRTKSADVMLAIVTILDENLPLSQYFVGLFNIWKKMNTIWQFLCYKENLSCF